MTKRAIRVLRELQGVEDLEKIKCLYCMDTGWCRVCGGVGKLPVPHGATIRAEICWRCNGGRKCPDCGGKNKRAL